MRLSFSYPFAGPTTHAHRAAAPAPSRRPAPARSLFWVFAIAALLLAHPAPAHAFAVFWTTYGDGDEIDVEASLTGTLRWPAEPVGEGFEARVEVWVSSTLASDLGIEDPELKERFHQVIVEAFREWENGGLRFDILFDQTTTGSTYSGGQIDVFAIRQHQYSCPSIGGCASVRREWNLPRLLTNGQSYVGGVITRSDLYIVTDYLTNLLSPESFDTGIEIFRQILLHESGHTIGLWHPNLSPYIQLFDTDDDPLNEMIFDPLDPYRDLRLTENHDCSAVMMGITGRCALAEDGLSFDDKAGRDMLYPVLALDGDGVDDPFDNCPDDVNPDQADSEGDGVGDACDNCLTAANGPLAHPGMQTDTDEDGYGNACDCDFNQDEVCDIEDFEIFLEDFTIQVDRGVGTDMNGDETVSIDDFGPFIEGFQHGQPGPSALVPSASHLGNDGS